MMRFLVVGCGGSGGHTLAYLMDQLRSDLARDGIERLPAGWQFLFFDVPTGIRTDLKESATSSSSTGHTTGWAPAAVTTQHWTTC